MKRFLTLAIFILAQTGFARGDDAFDKGVEAYKNGAYEAALEQFNIAAQHHQGLAINYNLGNTYYKLNMLTASILHYERALKFEPSNNDALHNLDLANEMIVDRIEVLPKSKASIWWDEFRYGLGPEVWGWVAIFFVFLAAAMLLLYFISRRPGMRRLGFFAAFISLSLGVVSYTLAEAASEFRIETRAAIIFSDKVDVKSEPREGSTNVFVLHAGTKVKVGAEDGGWVKVEIASGSQGWINKEDLEAI